ncbi:MAG: hypothetical protein DCF29_10100 [Alphaproteobacteria bacterium]|nr:MAG: hypothetical protein DCF29_10100 [Alphaproteobacteria bacterium]
MTVPAVKTERSKQIRAPLERAIRLMVEDGRTLSEAAQMTEYKDESLRKALAKPHVKSFVSSVKATWLSGETLLSWKTVTTLRDKSQSDKVRLDAAKCVIGAAGELASEQNHGPVAAVSIHFVVPDATVMPVANHRGIVEAPPYDPTTYRRMPSIEAVEHVDA